MKGSGRSFALVSLFFLIFALPPATAKARDAADKPPTLAAAQGSKQQRINTCRARYRDCLALKQIPSWECQTVYQDCIHSIT